MTEMIKNYGLLEEREIFAKDWRAGGVTGATKLVLRESGDYTDVLPELEIQRGVYFDTMACVTFSALNNLEILATLQGMKWNKSDRFTAKMSGTTKSGNYMRNVAESIRMHGLLPEEAWPFPNKQREPVFDWEDYYTEIPDDLKVEALKWLKDNFVEWEWQDVRALREALRFGPVQVTVYAWPKPEANGLYTDGGNTRRNHAVTLVNATDDYYEIFDHYDKSRKRLVPDYRFGSALQFSLLKNVIKPMPIELPNNILVQDSEDSGAFAMHLNGRLMVDDPGKVLATVLMRSPRVTVNGKAVVQFDAPVPLKRADWDNFPKVDLKGNPVA